MRLQTGEVSTLVKAVKISELCGFCFFNEERECAPVNCRDLTQANQVLSEKAMAPHSSILAWKIPWMEEPGRLQSMGLLKVGHDRATSLWLFTFTHWRRKWQPTPENPGTGEPGGPPSMGSHRVGRDWSDLAAAAAATRLYGVEISNAKDGNLP